METKVNYAVVGAFVLLLGGRHKGEPYTALAAPAAPLCRGVIAFGESRDIVVQDLEELHRQCAGDVTQRIVARLAGRHESREREFDFGRIAVANLILDGVEDGLADLGVVLAFHQHGRFVPRHASG